MPAPDVTVTPEGSRTKNDRRSASLDGLRGVAALAIFVFHGWLYTMPAPNASDRSSIADYAVHELRLALVAFFVLSGFLLSRPWFAAALGSGRPPNLRRYVRARAARVLPAYYAALAGSVVLLWGLRDTPGLRLPPAGELPLFVVFGQNFSAATVMKLNPPMWSLAVEVMFYALLPLIGWLALRLPATRRMQALGPLALLALGLFYNWTIAGQGLGLTFSKTLAAMLPYFAVGMLAALVLQGRRVDLLAKRSLIAAGVALIAVDAVAKAAAPANGLDVGDVFVVMRDLPSAVGFALIVVALAAAPQGRILSGHVLAGMGTISYGFYLWHVPVLMVLRGYDLLPLDPVTGTLMAFAPSIALAVLSWFAIERPILRWSARRDTRAREAELGGRGGVDRRGGGPEVATVRA
ncbi:MAG: acyltransferase family protein [Thermoleophilia bacterium]